MPKNAEKSLCHVYSIEARSAAVTRARTLALLERNFMNRPRNLVVGIGCHIAVSRSRIEEVIRQVFGEHKLAFSSIRNIATIDIKRYEPGLLDFARKHNLPVQFFSKTALKQVGYPSSPSSLVFDSVGIYAVCEPAALLSSNNGCLVVPKTKMNDITIAVARVSPEVAGEVRKF